MYCPQCEGEFRDGITVCPDCEVPLVESLAGLHDDAPFERVLEVFDPAILPLVRSLLDETDIPYTIENEEAMGLFPGTTSGLAVDAGGRAAEVLVPARRAAEARELLSEVDPDAGDDATDEESP
jgi:hypothetical protein